MADSSIKEVGHQHGALNEPSGAAIHRQRADPSTARLQDAQQQLDEQERSITALQQELRAARSYQHQCEVLNGTIATLKQEADRLRSARSVLDLELREARETVESQARQIAQLQGAAALAKSKSDEQCTQLRVLKQQLVDTEEEVCSPAIYN